MPSLLPPPHQLQHLVSPKEPKHPPGEMGAQSGESLFPEQVIISGMRLKFKSPVPNPGSSRFPTRGFTRGPCNPWPYAAIAASIRAKSCAGQSPGASLRVLLAGHLILDPTTSPYGYLVRLLLGSWGGGRHISWLREQSKSK